MSDVRRTEAYRRLVALPENRVGEIVGGELVVSPLLGGPGAVAKGAVAATLFGPFDARPSGRPGGWHILLAPELHLGGDVLVADLVGWRKERLPRGAVDDVFTVAPDWVCEILSPSSARHDRIVKMDI